jgi:hypothetical protein
VNRTSMSLRATWPTRSSPLGALCPALSPERVVLVAFPSGDPLSSPASAAPPWALSDRFAGTTGSSDFPRSSITGLRSRPSPHDPPYHHHKRVTVRPPGSRAWRLRACTWFSDPAGSDDDSRKCRRRCCLPLPMTASAPRPIAFTRLNSPACAYPYRRLAATLAGSRRTARGHRGSLFLRRRALSSPSPDRFIPALSIGTALDLPVAARALQSATSASQNRRSRLLPQPGHRGTADSPTVVWARRRGRAWAGADLKRGSRPARTGIALVV